MSADQIRKTEEALAEALRAYIISRSETAVVDDVIDDCIGAVNQCLEQNWSIDPVSSDETDV